MYPYYVVYFTVWPIIAFVAPIEAGGAVERKRPLVMVLCLVLLVGWIPSLTWNLMKHRESFLEYPNLSPTVFRQELARAVPPAAKLLGSPELLFLAHGADVQFVPLPWFGRNLEVDASSYLILTVEDLTKVERVAKTDLATRPIVFEGAAFPNSMSYKYPYVLFGPARKPSAKADP
jgi:hypothetical protein